MAVNQEGGHSVKVCRAKGQKTYELEEIASLPHDSSGNITTRLTADIGNRKMSGWDERGKPS